MRFYLLHFVVETVMLNPIPDAENLIKEAVSTYGVPAIDEQYPDGLEELVWKTPDTVIFANLSPTVTKVTPTQYEYSNRGLLKGVLKERSQSGRIVYKNGVYTHVDPAFFNELHEMNFPALELSFYEKQLICCVIGCTEQSSDDGSIFPTPLGTRTGTTLYVATCSAT